MEPKKNSKVILVVIILLVILILLTGIAYAYFATDMFKSNKELFFKYVKQMGDSKEGFIETQLEQYFEKQKSTPYTNEGSLALNITDENGNEKEYETINNFNISFVGKTDKTKEAEEQEVSINYSNNVTFPINYRKAENTIGLQTKYVSDKYVAVEMEQLENKSYEGLEDIQELQTSIGKLDELAQLPFSQEDWKEIQAKCQKILDEKLQESQFTKIEEGKRKGYKISIEGKQVKDIIIQLLETLKNDPKTLEKLNEYLKKQKNSASLTASKIDSYIKNLEESSEIDEEKYEITVFQENGKTNQVVIKPEEGAELKIEKQKIEDSVQYTISILVEEFQIAFRANYKGLEQLQNLVENYEVELQLEPSEEMRILEKARQNKNETEIADEKEKVMLLIATVKADNMLNDNSTITVQDMEKEKNDDSSNFYKDMEIRAGSEEKIIITFTDTKDEFEIDTNGNITKKPEQVASDKKTNSSNQSNKITYKYQYNNQINFESTIDVEEFSDNNAMILNNYEEEKVSNFVAQVVDRIKQVNQKQMEELGLQENENPLLQLLDPLLGITQYAQSMIAVQDTENEFQQMEINNFNSKFEAYESTNLKGVTVKGLLTTIGRNNESQKDDSDWQIKEIHFDGEEYEVTDQNILLLKGTVETETAYRVEFEKDEQTGIIYRVVINKK